MHSLLASWLPTLASLSFIKSDLAFSGDSITCLTALESLRLQKSRVRSKWDMFSTLTNLTLLDLAGTKFFDSHDRDALAFFVGWKKLRVLKVSECNLFGQLTRVRLSTPLDAEVSWLHPGLSCNQLTILNTFEDDVAMCGFLGEGRFQIYLLPVTVWRLVGLLVWSKFSCSFVMPRFLPLL